MKKQFILLLLLSALAYSTVFAQAAVDFEIRNEQVVGNNYEFDVYMAATQAGSYHTRGMVYFTYNAAAFGTNVMQNGNLTVNQAQLLNDQASGIPKYRTLSPADNASNTAAITWENSNLQAVGLNTNQALTELPTSMTKLYHVSLRMINNSAPANISLHSNLMQGQSFYAAANNNEVAYQDGVVSLPVEFLSFTGERVNAHDVKVSWTTAKEINNDYFIIEKKRGVNGSFEEISRVNSKENPSDVNNYDYLDQSGMANVNFYRLKQIDLDGTVTFSEIVEITMDELAENDKFVVFPSPAEDQTTLRSIVKLETDLKFEITDMNGKVVLSGSLPKASGKINIPLTGIAAGTYHVTTFANGKSYLNRLVKTN
ncbi:MAG: T9SS type A sorting domain-containing protein [Bacteroidia bacterium]